MTISEILEQTKKIGQTHGVSKIILFGSWAKGCAVERSDLDLAICGLSDSAFDRLAEEIDEIDTLRRIDLVNLDRCKNKELLEDIRLYGREI